MVPTSLLAGIRCFNAPPSSPAAPMASLSSGIAPFSSADLAGHDCHVSSLSQRVPVSNHLIRIAPLSPFLSFSVLHYRSSRCGLHIPAACLSRRADSSELFSRGATTALPTKNPPAPEFLALRTPSSIATLSKYPTCRCAPSPV